MKVQDAKTGSITWILLIIMSCCLFIPASMNPAMADRWTAKEDMPTPGFYLASSIANGKIYAIGGHGVAGGSWNVARGRIIEEYDPVKNTWTRKEDMPTARARLCACEVKGKIYVIGGFNGSLCIPTVEEYDPATDTWTDKEDMSTARDELAAAVVDDKIYVIGGWGRGDRCLSTVEEYDPTTDTWTKRADMPTARENPGVSVVNGKIYAFGGDLWWDDNAILKAVEEYDPMADKWSRKNDMPEGRSGSSAVTIGDRIYIVGGGDRVWGPYCKIVREYDPATDTYSSASDMPTARTLPVVSAIDGRIYAIGGAITPFVSTSTVEEYDTGFNLGKSVQAGGKFWLPWGWVKGY
jgi:N-acetylneuraminic acid mutarotase